MQKLLEEQKYSELKMMLQELQTVDRKLAATMKITVHKLEKNIQD